MDTKGATSDTANNTFCACFRPRVRLGFDTLCVASCAVLSAAALLARGLPAAGLLSADLLAGDLFSADFPAAALLAAALLVDALGAAVFFSPVAADLALGALAGAVACFAATLLIDVKSALFAAVVFAGLFYYVRKFVMTASFGDARRGFFYSRTRDNLLTLSSLPVHPKNWRPTVAVFAGEPNERLHLIKYADWLSSSR
ncbi:MAG: hypothetical protein FWF83_06500, partial [Clostridiales bacterium]|nr:hypothetical protein [Clostridiales bacterium]